MQPLKRRADTTAETEIATAGESIRIAPHKLYCSMGEETGEERKRQGCQPRPRLFCRDTKYLIN